MNPHSGFFKVFSPHDWDGIANQLPDSGCAKVDTYNELKEASVGKSVFSQKDFDQHRPDKDHFLIHTVALGDREHYGANKNCFFKDTPVRTPNGFVLIQDIKEGDLVLTHKGRYRRVTQLFRSKNTKSFVRFRATCLALPVESTEEHPFDVLPSEHVTHDKLYNKTPKTDKRPPREKAAGVFTDAVASKREFRPAAELRPGDWVLVPNETPDADPKRARTKRGSHGVVSDDAPLALFSPDVDAWVLGLFVAEGCLVREYRNCASLGEVKGMVFTLGACDDAGVIPRLLNEIQRHGNRSTVHTTPNTSEGRRLDWTNKRVADTCNALFGGVSTSKTLRSPVFAWSREDKLKLIAGWTDGDGCLTSSKKHPRCDGTLTVSSASHDLVSAAQRLLASCSVPSSVVKSLNKEADGCFGKGDLPIYQLSVGASYSSEILQYSARWKPHTRSVKPSAKARVTTEGLWVMLKEVSLVEADDAHTDTYNFAVEEDNSYVTTVSGHNCDSWERDELIKKSHTFVSHGAYYREHRNTGPKVAIGSIKAAAYNPKQGWTELLVHGNLKPTKESSLTAEPEYERLKAGKEVDHSMSARIDHDECEVCFKKAKTRREYCDDMKKRAGQFDARTQRIVAVRNIDPTFIDISSVAKRACRVARYLSWMRPDGVKAASAETIENPTGADLAAHYGMGEGSLAAMPSSFAKAVTKLAGAETALAQLRSSKESSVRSMARMFGNGVTCEDWDDAELAKAAAVRPERLLRKLAKVSAVMPPLTFMSWFANEPISVMREKPSVKEACCMCDGLASDVADNGFRMLSASDLGAFEPCNSGMEDRGDNIDDLMDSAKKKFSVEGPEVGERVLRLTITIGLGKSAAVTAPSGILTTPESYDARLLAESYLAYKAATVAHLEQTRGSAFISDFLLSTLVGQNSQQ